MAETRVQAEPFDIAEETERVLGTHADIGGIGSFLGVVRSDPERPLAALCLEHYPGMTERALQRIAEQAESRWNLLGCRVVHRYGRLLPGEPIVLVIAAAAHRQAALDATAFLIDWLKTRAPFWKQEEFADGERSWVAARDADEAAAQRWG
jgi:molybdopterin synthase catalytic subunit